MLLFGYGNRPRLVFLEWPERVRGASDEEIEFKLELGSRLFRKRSPLASPWPAAASGFDTHHIASNGSNQPDDEIHYTSQAD